MISGHQISCPLVIDFQVLQATAVTILSAPDVVWALPTHRSCMQDHDHGLHRRFLSAAHYIHVGRVYHSATRHQELVDLGLLDLPTRLC